MLFPNDMRYINHGSGGSAEVLLPARRPVPIPGDDEVLIEVHYAGVNRPDVQQRNGSYAPPPDASPVIGLEVSGTVVALGPNVALWRVGDAVCALCAGGGYAEYVVVNEGHCLAVPSSLTMLQAAAIPENYFTVWANVMQRARLKAGETFLVHGGSSGIGYTAIQVARLMGAVALCTVGNKEKQEFCIGLGAALAINYREDDFVAAVNAITNSKGVDVILDIIGGDYLPKNLSLLALDGRLAQIGFMDTPVVANMNFMTLMLKRLTIIGSTLRARSVADKSQIASELKAHVMPALADGRLRIVVNSVFPLEHANQAHTRLETNAHMGKVMLQVKA